MKADLATVVAQGIPIPDGRAKVEYCDHGPNAVPGLVLEARRSSPPGTATLAYRYKNQYRETRYIRLGSTPDMSIANARKEARVWRSKVTLGADPKLEAKKQREVMTYDTFMTEHYTPWARVRKRSFKRDMELYRLRIKRVFGDKRLNQIGRQSIATFLTALVNEGLAPATANHHVKLIRSSLNLAKQWEMFDGENPAKGIQLLPEENLLHRLMDDDSLARLLGVLRPGHARGHAVSSVALFLLSTGVRLNEALAATWDDVNLEQRTFTVRASNSKSRRIRSVPLNDSAIDILNALPTKATGGPLFRGRRGEPLKFVSKVWGALRRRAGLPELRLHDLRHQYASFLVNDGQSIYTVSAILGHSTVKVTERYAHLSTKTLQQAAASASARILGGSGQGAQ